MTSSVLSVPLTFKQSYACSMMMYIHFFSSPECFVTKTQLFFFPVSENRSLNLK